VEPTLPRLSQGHLTLLSTCPRQFQHAYLDGLQPPEPDSERLLWGKQFHLLMQQRELGLEISTLLAAEDARFGQAIAALVAAAPELFAERADTWRAAEHVRTLAFEGYLLTVAYDLLLVAPERAAIVDWKTYLRPPAAEQRSRLRDRWQTRLYLFVLAETADCAPEQLSFTYWFVNPDPPRSPERLDIPYSREQHERTRRDLSDLLARLSAWWREYDERGTPFPQVPEIQNLCPDCPHATRCQRQPDPDPPGLERLAVIEEIAL